MPPIVFDAVATVVIPFLVELLKKVKLPTKWAPFVAVGLALGYVTLAKALGLAGADFQGALAFILKALGIGAISVLGYDVVKAVNK